MTKTLIGAHTKIGSDYPGYINVTRTESGVVVTVRADPEIRQGAYICGHPADKGKPGRCTPGDERCNNYCNMAAAKGPMQDAPAPCTQVIEGSTSAVELTEDEWKSLLREINI